jgi:hypothetical protein
MNSHEFLQVSALVSDFIPFVGPFISLGLIARDAQLYNQEGNQKEAASQLVWSIIPGLQIAKKFGLNKLLSYDGFKKLGAKLLSGTKLYTLSEKKAIEVITKNRKAIQNEIVKNAELTIKEAKNKVKLKRGLKTAAATTVGTGLASRATGEYINKLEAKKKKKAVDDFAAYIESLK